MKKLWFGEVWRELWRFEGLGYGGLEREVEG